MVDPILPFRSYPWSVPFRFGVYLYHLFATMAQTLSITLYTTSRKGHADHTQDNTVSHTYWPRNRRALSPTLMTIPGELRNRICHFVFDIAHQPDGHPANLNNDHLHGHFDFLLCSRQIRREQSEQLFAVDRFFQHFEALDAWISHGVLLNPEMLPRVRQVGMQTGRTRRRPECDSTYNDSRIQKAFLRLSGLKTLHISSPYALRSFVMTNEEVSAIMSSICKVLPNLERLAFLVPSENLDFLYRLPNLRFLAITTPTFFDANHLVSVVSTLSKLKSFRVRDKSSSSAFARCILSHMPAMQEIQLKDDTTTGRVVVPEMMDALLQSHRDMVNALHLEVSKFGREGNLNAIVVTLPKLPHLSILKLWYDAELRENEVHEVLLDTLLQLRKLKNLHLCFRPPKLTDPELIYQSIMKALGASGPHVWYGEYWINGEGYVLDDGHSGWVKDGNALKPDELYGTVWPSNKKIAWAGKGRYFGCMQVRAWR